MNELIELNVTTHIQTVRGDYGRWDELKFKKIPLRKHLIQ